MKHVYPLHRKKKNGKSKINIEFQFLILNWKLNGRVTHGPRPPAHEAISICLTTEIWVMSSQELRTNDNIDVWSDGRS